MPGGGPGAVERVEDVRLVVVGDADAPVGDLDPDPAGTGLGLAICRRIVERHGGTIGVEDNPGGGTRLHFTVSLAAVPVPGELVLAERR